MIDQLGPKGGRIKAVTGTFLPYKSRNGYYMYVDKIDRHDSEIKVSYYRTRYYTASKVTWWWLHPDNSTRNGIPKRYTMDYMNPCETNELDKPTFKMAWKGDITWKHLLFG